MKTYAVADSNCRYPERHSKHAHRAHSGKSKRDCITLSDPTDCLLEAYDCVARRAYENFLARGPRPGGELADWLRAERELLLGFTINVEDSAEFVYALASIPGATAERLEVGIESRWLVILAQDSRPHKWSAMKSCRESRAASILASRRPAANRRTVGAAGRHEESSLDDERTPSKSVCILELPAAVDAARSIAILSRWPPRHPHAEINFPAVKRTAVGFVGARYIVPGKHAWQCRTIRADVALRP